MSFLNPALFAVLFPLLGIPLLIHLLNRTFPRRIPFPSIEHLRKTVAQRSRLYRWRHLILLLLRTLALIMIVLAFLKPVWERYGKTPAADQTRSVLILLDHSLSMEYAAHGQSPRRRAIVEAQRLIDSLSSDDLVNVLLVETRTAPAFLALTRDHLAVRHYLDTIGPGNGLADFSAANRSASEQLVGTDHNAEIFYISDFQRQNWADVDFRAVPPNARCFYIDVGAPQASNTGVLRAAFSSDSIRAGEPVVLTATVGNYAPAEREIPLTLDVGGAASFSQSITVPPWSTAEVSFPIQFKTPGYSRCVLRIPRDDLAGDDRFHLVANVLEQEQVMLLSDSAPDSRDAAFFLETALNPFAEEQGPVAPRRCLTRQLDTTQLANTRKVIASGCGPLTEAQCRLLADYLFDGGSLVYFLDNEHAAANLVGLEAALGAMPLRAGPAHQEEQVLRGGQHVIRGDFASPYLSIFKGALRRSLSQLEFYDFHYASSTGQGRVLMQYTDGTPAMAGLQHGLGTVLLMNFSVHEMSSNVARQRIFPAWIHHIIKTLSVETAAGQPARVGLPAHDEIWAEQAHPDGILGPDGKRHEMQYERIGSRLATAFTPTQPGFYTLGEGPGRYMLAVNTHPAESDLRRVDQERLPDQTGRDGLLGHLLDTEADFSHVTNGVPIFHLFILAAAVALALETAFQLLILRIQRT